MQLNHKTQKLDYDFIKVISNIKHSEHSSLSSSLSKMTDLGWPIRVECIIALLLAEYALTVLGWILVWVFLVLSIKLGESNGEGE